MPLVALNSAGERVTIFDVIHKESREEYYCPFCKNRMHVVHSVSRIPHFRHNPRKSCGYGNKETEKHLKMKMVIGLWLISKGWEVDFEVKIGKRVADIVAKKEFKMIVEVQHSTISYEEVIIRSAIDKQQGFKTLWIFDDIHQLRKLAKNLEQNGYKVYILNTEEDVPLVDIAGEFKPLRELKPLRDVNNFVILALDSSITNVDFCPNCYYTDKDFVILYDYDLVKSEYKGHIYLCPRCGFKLSNGGDVLGEVVDRSI